MIVVEVFPFLGKKSFLKMLKLNKQSRDVFLKRYELILESVGYDVDLIASDGHHLETLHQKQRYLDAVKNPIDQNGNPLWKGNELKEYWSKNKYKICEL